MVKWILVMVVFPAIIIAADVHEEQALALDRMLVAPCCWTQTLNHHHSQIAQEMRRDIRRMLLKGKSAAEIIDHYQGIYGTRILAMPPAKGFLWSAYLTPVAFILGGGFLVWGVWQYWYRQKEEEGPHQAVPPVDPAYSERLRRELDEETA